MGIGDFLGGLMPHPNLDDPKTLGLLAAGLQLLQPVPKQLGTGGAIAQSGLLGLKTYAEGKQSQMQQQAMERANRANDLQQLMGVQSALQAEEFPKIMAARQGGQPYTPNPALQAVNQRILQLATDQNLSGKMGGSPAPVAPPTAPSGLLASPPQTPPDAGPPMPPMGATAGPPPQMPPPTPPQMPSPQMPAAGGYPVDLWMAASRAGPGALAFLKQGAEDKKPQNLRPGGTLTTYDPNTGQATPVFYGPKMDAGIQPTFGPNGQVSAGPIPGYREALAGVEAAKAAAGAIGKLPFQKPDTIQTTGAPTLMTPAQQIQAATGQNPLAPPGVQTQIPPEVQAQRNAQQAQILRSEGPSPQVNTQLAALQQAQQNGNPFSYSTNRPPGLPLQDQTDAAAQQELGKGLGTQALDVFKNGAASVQQQKLLAQMSDMAQNFTPGVFQPLKAQFGAYLIGAGIPQQTVDKALGTNVGSIQALTSAAIQMAGKLTRQTDAQPSQLQFLKTLESMPASARTADGFQKIMQYLNDSHQYNIDKMISQQQWLDNPAHDGSIKGFEAAWAKQANTLPYVWNMNNQGPRGGSRVIDFKDLK